MQPNHCFALLATLVLLAPACRTAPTPPPRNEARTARARPQSRPAVIPRRAPAQPPILSSHSDAPPAGVPREYVQNAGFSIGIGGSAGCPGAAMSCVNGRCKYLGNLFVYPYISQPEVLTPLTLCVTGLGDGVTVNITITGPAGSITRLRRVARDVSTLRLETLLPSGPPGRYTFLATTSANRYTRALVVKAASRRTVHVVPMAPHAGMELQVGLVRYPPRKALLLHVYHLERQVPQHKNKPATEHFRYKTTLRLVTDKHGHAIVPLRSLSSAPKGRYNLAFKPGQWIGAFELGEAVKK